MPPPFSSIQFGVWCEHSSEITLSVYLHPIYVIAFPNLLGWEKVRRKPLIPICWQSTLESPKISGALMGSRLIANVFFVLLCRLLFIYPEIVFSHCAIRFVNDLGAIMATPRHTRCRISSIYIYYNTSNIGSDHI